MKIAIDASRSTVERATGTEHYARQLIYALIELNEQRNNPHEIVLYFRDHPAPNLFPQSRFVTQTIIPFPRLWTHIRLAAALWLSHPDVTFVPAHSLPISFPGAAVVTVHDLGYKHFPDAHEASQVRYLDWSTRHSANRATRILADSQATADDLQLFYGIHANKIDVVYPGVDAPKDKPGWELYSKYEIPLSYFLFIGTLQPRKNIERIVRAFDMWQGGNPDKNIGLVLAGKEGWLFDARWIEGVDNVHLIGYVDDEDKGALLRQSTALIFPSLYEGFGFPVIEAMHMGTAVIASNTSSLPELVGEAGILVDPLSIPEIAASLDLIANNDLLRRKLGVKGMMQAKQFTWQKAAEQTLNILEDAAKL
ncbi:MAG: glycosyltransferase family 1 protein [Phototrophicaceae bacterium]